MKKLILATVLVAALSAPGSASSATVYGNSASWNGTDELCCWGPSSTSTYGETFAGTGADLRSFTFKLDVNPNIVFQGAVATWDGTKAGTILWQSGDQTTGGSNGTYTDVTFTLPGGVTLQSGQDYVLFATTLFSSQPPTTTPSDGRWASTKSDTLAGGQMVWFNVSTSTQLTSQTWDGGVSTWDMVFTATFTATGSGSASDACPNLSGTQATVPDGFTVGADGSCYSPPRVLVCAAKPVPRADGTSGLFVDLDAAVWQSERNVPSSPYYGSRPAIYVDGYGLMCSLSDLVTYGGDPSRYEPAPDGVGADDGVATYTRYVQRR